MASDVPMVGAASDEPASSRGRRQGKDTLINESALTLDSVIDAIQGVLGGQMSGSVRLAADTRLDDLDIDSLDGAELFLRLEEVAGVPLDPASAAKMKTVGELTTLQPAST